MRLLAYTTPNLGHLYPVVPILEELRSRGHEVAVCTRADHVAVLRGLGLDARPLDPGIEAMKPEDWRGRGGVNRIAAALRFAAARAHLELEQLPVLVDELEPDALLVDPASFGAFAYAQAVRRPWALYSPFALPMSSVDVPPWGPGLPPARGRSGRLRDALVRALAAAAYQRALEAAKPIRVRVGLPPDTSIDGPWRAAPLVLLLSAVPFEYPRRDWAPNVRVVGPCLWEPPQPPIPWLNALEEPAILITASSVFQNDRVLLETALAAFPEPSVSLVASAAAHDARAFNAPAHARIEPFLPYSQVIPRCACVVTQGGMGTVQQALAAGVPVCAVPFARDQLENARRVEVAGAGTRLSPRRLTTRRLRHAIEEAIGRRAGAIRIAEAFARLDAPRTAADELEALAESSSDRRPRDLSRTHTKPLQE